MEPDGPTQPREQVPPTAPPPADQQPAPTAPTEPASHWAAAATEQGRRSTVPGWLAWLVAPVVVGFNAFMASRTAGDPGTPRMLGYMVGAFLAPFVIALIARAVFVVLRRRTPRGAILRSPWLPLTATVLAGLSLAGNIASLAPPTAIDPNTVVRISPPFTLREASSETAGLAEEALKADKSVRSYAFREVVGEDGSVSMLLVADGALRSGELDGVAKGIQDAAGIVPTTQSIGGRDVVVAVGDQLAVGAWIEEPAFISVYAADEATLRAVVEAVLRAPKT
jgi:hypothetical protein